MSGADDEMAGRMARMDAARMRPSNVVSFPTRAAAIRATALSEFAATAASVVDSDPVIATFAACEWEELTEDGKQWACALIRETLARQAEGKL